ncbi:MAG: hypothetical protein BVN32_09495 [Proteobacteria bacterium ST_bin14]|nr:MAG: hypothetical protein BVN32_09495 [Proteobacteria bacterium ST_bin14]
MTTNGNTLTLTTTGAGTQSAAFTTAGLVLNGNGGSYTLTNAGNVLTSLTGTTGSINLVNSAAATSVGPVTTTGALSVTANGAASSLTVAGAVSATNTSLTSGTGGIALNAGVTTNGNALTLTTTGAGTQSAAFTTAGLVLNGSGGAYTLTNAGNVLASLTGTTGSIDLVNSAAATSVGPVTTTGALSVTANGAASSLTVAGAVSATVTSLTSGTGGIALGATVNTNGNTLTLTTTGAGTQSAAFTTAGLVLNGSGGAYTLTNAGNVLASVTGTTGSIDLVNSAAATSVGPVTTTGALSVNATANGSDITVAGAVSTGGISQLNSLGTVTIANTGNIATSAEFALIAGTNFINQAGSNAITTSNGARWLIYSQGPQTNVFGGLASGNQAAYGVNATTTPPSAVSLAGNRYLFATSPTVTVTAVDASKVYGDTLDAMSNRPFTVSGLVNAAAFGNVFTQDVLIGTPAFASPGDAMRARVGAYTTTIGLGSLTGLLGYTFSFVNGVLTVTPKALTATLVGGVTKIYDGNTTATLAAGNYALNGVVSGPVNGVVTTDDVVLNNPTTGQYDNRNVGTGKLVTVNGLTISGADAANYTINTSASAAVGQIDPKALIASVTGSVIKTYDGTNAAMLVAGNYNLGGVVSGDTVVLNNPIAGLYDNRNAGSMKTVTVNGIAISGADASNYVVNTSANAAVGQINRKALNVSLTGMATKIYDGTTTATLAASNYLVSGLISGDTVAINPATTGLYDNANVGMGKIVTVNGLTTIGADAGNYIVNTNGSVSGAIGQIDPRTITVSLIGTVTRVANGTTTATVAPENFSLSGFVTGEGARVNQTMAEYASAMAGMNLTVTTILSLPNFEPIGGTLLSNYSLPIGPVAGPIGTLTAQAAVTQVTAIVATVTVQPPAPPPAPAPAPAPAPVAAPAPPPAPAPAPAAAPAPDATPAPSGGSGGAPPPPPVDASPPSPVPTEKPPTPKDAADAGDPVLASVSGTASDAAPTSAVAKSVVSEPIAGGLLTAQRRLPPRTEDVPGLDDGFSGSGNIL